MSLIDIVNLSFTYDGSYDPVFENVSFQLDTDWKLGFVGRNGRGKTTFLNLLLGKFEYSGTISAATGFDYFPFPVENQGSDTLSVVEQASPGCEYWRLQKELNRLQVPEEALYRPFDTLSSGERTKVLLAALFLRENRFLLIDEPTNHLDRDARRLVGDYLNTKKGFILVSHDRAFLDRCVDHVLSINRQNIEVQKGNFSSWFQNKLLKDDFERGENEKLKKEIGRLSAAAKRSSHWSDQVEGTKYQTRNSGLRPDRGFIGHKAAKMMKRSKAIEARKETALEEKSGLLKNIETTAELKIQPLAYHTGRLVSLEDVAIRYGGKTACEHVSFLVERGERIALQGKNGCGKSSILKLILGEGLDFDGTLLKGSGLILSYVPQDTAHLRGGLSDYARHCGIDESLFKAILRKMDFSRTQFEKDMEDYSGGQKKKVLIARSLCERAHLYLWDEPLNFIDVFSRMQIEELLKSFQPTLLFVEHDQAFTDQIATKIISL